MLSQAFLMSIGLPSSFPVPTTVAISNSKSIFFDNSKTGLLASSLDLTYPIGLLKEEGVTTTELLLPW